MRSIICALSALAVVGVIPLTARAADLGGYDEGYSDRGPVIERPVARDYYYDGYYDAPVAAYYAPRYYYRPYPYYYGYRYGYWGRPYWRSGYWGGRRYWGYHGYWGGHRGWR